MRLMARLVACVALAVLATGTARAVTLEQYFYGFSDRDRGVYLTGVLDLFAADSSRDPEYRQCVAELGAAGMHEAISSIVREDPRLLTFDAALWVIYEASRQCNTSASEPGVPDPRSLVSAAEEAVMRNDDVPDLASTQEAAEGLGEAAPAARPWSLFEDWRYLVPAVLLIVLAIALAGIGFLRRRGRTPPAQSGAPRPPAETFNDDG